MALAHKVKLPQGNFHATPRILPLRSQWNQRVIWLTSDNLSFLKDNSCKHWIMREWRTSLLSEIKCWIAIVKLNGCGGLIKRVKMVKNVPRSAKWVPSFSSPSWAIKIACKRKHEIDHSPEWAQPKLFPQGEPLGKRTSVTAPSILLKYSTNCGKVQSEREAYDRHPISRWPAGKLTRIKPRYFNLHLLLDPIYLPLAQPS